VAKPTSIQDGENHEATRKKLERLQALLAAEHSRDDEACFKKAVLSLRQYSQRITGFSNLDALNSVPSLVAAVNRLIFEFGKCAGVRSTLIFVFSPCHIMECTCVLFAFENGVLLVR